MSNFLDSLQVELIFSLIIMVVMAIFFIYAGKKFATADPTARPKGVVLVVETGVKMIYDYLKVSCQRNLKRAIIHTLQCSLHI